MRTLFILGILILSLLSSCGVRQAPVDKKALTVTILPFAYFASELAGDRFIVHTLVPPGANHHSFDPAPKQIRDLEQSAILFINGRLGFEEVWVPTFRKNYPNLVVADLSAGLNLIEVEAGEGVHVHEEGDDHHHHEGAEPHYWLSPREAKALAANMASGLKRVDPEGATVYEANLERLLVRLDSLDQAYAERLSGLSQKSFIIFHPALTYIARDYGLTQIPMELDGKEPTAAHFRHLVAEAKKSGINTIFVQREYDRENAVALAREIDARIVTIDPMSGDWLGEMKALLDKLVGMGE